MRMPIPSAREVRGAFYIGAICALAFTLTICWVIFHKINQSDEIVHVAAAATGQFGRLSTKIDQQNAKIDQQKAQLDAIKHQAALDALAGSRERRALREQNHRLLDFLRSLGIAVPRSLIWPSDGGGGAGPKGQAGGQPSHPRPSNPPGTPAPTGTPTPTDGPTVLGIDLGPICAFMPAICTVF